MNDKEIRTDLRQPCCECPFRKNSAPGWLGPFTPEGILRDAVDREGGFVCHRTNGAQVHQFCAGAAIFLNRILKRSRVAVYASYQLSLRDAGDEVVNNVLPSREAFIEHHTSLGRHRAECPVMEGPHCLCRESRDDECCYCDLGRGNCLDDGDDDEDGDEE